MFDIFIRRPVLSLVISLIITLVGLLALFRLPVTQFPEIVPPSVIVTAKYTGANAEVCTKAVAIPLERAINGVPGMTYMTSVTGNDGITLVQIFFQVGTDPDLAAVNVQNRVQSVINELPEEVIRAGVTTEKEVNSMLLYLNVFSEDAAAGEEFVYNFADINVLQELKRIDGVGRCEIMGAREYSMRVWLSRKLPWILVNVQKSAARVTQFAVQQVKAQLLNTQSLEAQVQQQIIQVENGLNLLLGRFPQPIQRGEPIDEQVLPQSITAGIPSDMLRRRPDVVQAELELRAAKADVDAARASFLPALAINPYAGFNAFNTSLLFNPGSLAYGVVGGLAAPLINRAPLKAAYKQSQAENATAYYTYRKAVLQAYEEALTNLRRIENFERITSIKQEEVQTLREAVATSNDLFLTGFASYLEVITAQKNVLEAELGLTDARKEQFFSLIDLYRALGGGWE